MPGGLLAALGIARLRAYVESLARYVVGQTLLATTALVFLAVAVAFAVTALTIWLTSLFGAAVAFVILAGGFLLMALVLLVAMSIRKHGQARRTATLGESPQPNQAALAAVAAVAAIGYLLGRRFDRH